VRISVRGVGEHGDEHRRRLQHAGEFAHEIREERRPAGMRDRLRGAVHRARGSVPAGEIGVAKGSFRSGHRGHSRMRGTAAGGIAASLRCGYMPVTRHTAITRSRRKLPRRHSPDTTAVILAAPAP